MCVCTHWRSRVRVHACVDPCAFASTVPSHFPSVITRRCGRGRQNSRTRSLAHTHTGAKNSLKLEGGKHRGPARALHPQLQAPSLSLVTSQHRASLPNTIEMPLRQNAHQTGPQPCHGPSYPTETSSCFSSPFIPSLSLHLIAALQPPCPSPPFHKFKEIHFVLFSDLSPDSRRRLSTTVS